MVSASCLGRLNKRPTAIGLAVNNDMARFWYTSEATRLILRTLGVAIGILILIAVFSRLPFAERVAEQVQFYAVQTGTGLGRALGRLFASEQSLGAQLASCQTETANLALASVGAAAREQEIKELQALLAYTPPPKTNPVAARIIARAIDGDPSTVLIDQGETDGLVEGAAVIVGNGMLYGMVYAVREQTAVVRLVTHPDVQVPAGILGKAPTIGLTHGREGDLLSMEFVPQDIKLSVGDLVVTSGLDGHLPANLLLGKVMQINDTESAPFQDVLLGLFYDPRGVTALLVLNPIL